MDFAETLEKLIELQALDSGLDELDRIKRNLEKEIEASDHSLDALKSELQDEKKILEELLKRQKTGEMEVGTLESKIKKYHGQESEVKSNEQYAALKQEIEKGKEEKAKAEERVLEVLFQQDAQREKTRKLAEALAQAEKKAEGDRKAAREKIEDCEKSALGKREERVKKLAELPADFAGGYEALRNSGKKVALAEVREDKTCGGCHMSVPPQVLNDIRKGMALQRCNCGRFLYEKN